MPTTDPNSWAYHPDFADILIAKDRLVLEQATRPAFGRS
jgi:hypothetical protein